MGDYVTEGWIARFTNRVRNFFRNHERQCTELEHTLQRQVASLNDLVDDLQAKLGQVTQECNAINSRAVIMQQEIDGLIGVIARDRKRVEAETAIAATKIARATQTRS